MFDPVQDGRERSFQPLVYVLGAAVDAAAGPGVRELMGGGTRSVAGRKSHSPADSAVT